MSFFLPHRRKSQLVVRSYIVRVDDVLRWVFNSLFRLFSISICIYISFCMCPSAEQHQQTINITIKSKMRYKQKQYWNFFWPNICTQTHVQCTLITTHTHTNILVTLRTKLENQNERKDTTNPTKTGTIWDDQRKRKRQNDEQQQQKKTSNKN